eukprot:COSAG01_NODE_74_length_28433_cov_41.582269_32_plen_90_part_00
MPTFLHLRSLCLSVRNVGARSSVVLVPTLFTCGGGAGVCVCGGGRVVRRVTADLLCSTNGLEKLAKISRDPGVFKRSGSVVGRQALSQD